jgi:hypothetical protein
MAPGNSSIVVAACVGLVFGLAGGVAGAKFFGAGPPITAGESSSPFTSAPHDPALRVALDELTRELRALHESLGNRLESPTRQAASTGAPVDIDRLTAVLDKLVASTGALPATPSHGSRHAPLIGADRPARLPRLRELMQIETEVRSRQHRFLNHQQVLDQFGAPDDVYTNGTWRYDVAGAGGLEFEFFDGMLIHIY